MQEFMRKFEQLNEKGAKVILEHCLFDSQEFYCTSLQTISDDDRVGIILKGKDIFMYKHSIKEAKMLNNIWTISNDRFNITIILDKKI